MTTLKIAGIVLSGITATSGISLTYAWKSSDIVIAEELKDYLLKKENNDNDWTTLQKRLNTFESTINSKELIGLSTVQETNQQTPSSGEKLKNWCSENYEKRINLLFSSRSTKDLFEYVKKFCILTIKEKIEAGKTIDTESNNGKSDWESRFDELKQYSGTNNGSLTSELNQIKEGQKDTHWSKLRDWCKSTYNLGYVSSDNNNWKLANKFCKKT